jgi:3-hydroxyisobutyrate dehydrogenase-like beta-hydroxyacid dehydrogenase
MRVAILMPGDMGHGVGQALIAAGHEVVTALDGRSERTRGLARSAGIRDAGALDSAVGEAELVLSILPPDRAEAQAAAVADAMRRTGARPAYVDCNAVSPMTMRRIAAKVAGAGAPVIDAGIIGLNPVKAPGTRFYVSGPDCAPMLALDCDAIRVRAVGAEIGRASALKMAYAALTKGTAALQAALLLAALRLDVYDELVAEFGESQAGTLKSMRDRVPFLPADSARWAPEMDEIADSFAAVGLPQGFHRAAAELYRVIAGTPLAAETRETMDRTRTLEEALAAYAAALDQSSTTSPGSTPQSDDFRTHPS